MNVLFLCTGNSARSQMAEALATRLSGGRAIFCSAGTWPSRMVHPLAVAAMAEVGIDISENVPKSFTSVPKPIHHIIAVCGQAEAECPRVDGVNVEKWDVDDPVPTDGNGEIETFRRVRNDLELRVRDLLKREGLELH